MIKKLKKERTALVICLVLSMIMHLIYGLEGMKQVQAYEFEIERQAAQLQDKDYQIEILEIILENREQDASEPLATEPEFIGTFTVTHYCPCEICCGKSDGVTYSGVVAEEGRTVAVDPDVIPLGSTVIIDGQEYIAEDVGGVIKNNKIDMFVADHQRALDLGVIEKEVYLFE